MIATAGIGAAAVLALLFTTFGDDQEAWARDEAIPEIERLAQLGEWDEAHRLAAAVEAAVPDFPDLPEIRSTVSMRRVIHTDPQGATVRRRAFGTDDEWEPLGTTPLDQVLVPFGPSAFQFELAGHRMVERLFSGGALNVRMDPVDALPEEMVRVDAFSAPIDDRQVALGDFLMDRFEVTNRQFAEFVAAGGYEREEFWDHPFADGGRTLSWQDAMARFTDRTGRPGPSTWEVGTYPDGEDDYPVTGVSWYEAAAYARFVEKDLPTVHHWRQAFTPGQQAFVLPEGNLDAAESLPVGQSGAMSRFGTYDMVGNVREWTHNDSEGLRFILGGGWNDPTWVAYGPFAQEPLDRSQTNGIRLVRYLDETGLDAARAPVPPVPLPDFSSYEPVSDEVFAIYRRYFEYDRTPLEARVERVDSARYWTRERVTFDAGYGDERMVLYLYVPRDREPPHQAVMLYPGSNALGTRDINALNPNFDFLLKSGRAVALPIYRGTFERPSNLETVVQELGLPFLSSPNPTSLYREHVIHWATDLGRSIDYLEERDDIDADRLAFYGTSWGGRMGSIMLAVETRFDAAVLYTAGFSSNVPLPEVHAVTYAPRVTTPVLMLNGRYDHIFPFETNAIPMFEMLGTPEEHKRQVVSDGGHFVPRTITIRETLAWLDRYLGPVR